MVWESAEGKHAEKWRVWPVNMGLCLSIDETALIRGELYMIISNRNAHGGGTPSLVETQMKL